MLVPFVKPYSYHIDSIIKHSEWVFQFCKTTLQCKLIKWFTASYNTSKQKGAGSTVSESQREENDQFFTEDKLSKSVIY